MKTLKVAGNNLESIVDGPGVRYVLYLQGCKHNCKGCHNPETHSEKGGVDIPIENLIRNIVRELDDNPILSGLTISGGDPLEQADGVLEMIKGIKKSIPNLNIWVYTGYEKDDDKMNETSAKEIKSIVSGMVYGKFIEELRTMNKRFVGSSNQEIVINERTSTKTIEWDTDK